MNDLKLHPGHQLLRVFLPNGEDRRLFVRLACSGDMPGAWATFYARRASNSPSPTQDERNSILDFIQSI